MVTGHFGTVTDSYRFGTTCKIPISVFCFVEMLSVRFGTQTFRFGPIIFIQRDCQEVLG